MWGIFENIGWALEDLGMAVTDKAMQTMSGIDQAIHSEPVKLEGKSAEFYKKLVDECMGDNPIKANNKDDDTEDSKYFVEIIEKILTHEDFKARNPIDIGIECGYPEEDVKQAIGLLAQKIQNM